MNHTLTVLNLELNGVGEGGAQAIAEALRANHTLTKLYLGDNRVGDAGAHAIAEALRVNHTLTMLNLHGNAVGEGGAQTIAETLRVNHTLTELHLVSNRVGEGGKLERQPFVSLGATGEEDLSCLELCDGLSYIIYITKNITMYLYIFVIFVIHVDCVDNPGATLFVKCVYLSISLEI